MQNAKIKKEQEALKKLEVRKKPVIDEKANWEYFKARVMSTIQKLNINFEKPTPEIISWIKSKDNNLDLELTNAEGFKWEKAIRELKSEKKNELN
jgi:hypothetical protein